MGFIADQPLHANIDIVADGSGARHIIYTNALGIRITVGSAEPGQRHVHGGQIFVVEPTGIVTVKDLMIEMPDAIAVAAFALGMC